MKCYLSTLPKPQRCMTLEHKPSLPNKELLSPSKRRSPGNLTSQLLEDPGKNRFILKPKHSFLKLLSIQNIQENTTTQRTLVRIYLNVLFSQFCLLHTSLLKILL